MEILYCKMDNHNFGDELNLHLWKNLLPSLHDTHNDQAILGIGTLQGLAIPSSSIIKKIHVLGTGGNGASPEGWLDSRFKIHFLRGPLTAKTWNVQGKDIADSAYLIRLSNILDSTDVSPTIKKEIGYIPHHHSDSHSDISYICHRAGLKYISPRQENVLNFISQVKNCSYVITEALHGAIIADALRVPWQSVKSGEQVFDFKWQDWAASINLEKNQPKLIDFCLTRGMSPQRRLENALKRTLVSAGLGKKKWVSNRVFFDSRVKLDLIAEQLTQIKSENNYQLSQDSTVQRIDSQLFDAMHSFSKELGLTLITK